MPGYMPSAYPHIQHFPPASSENAIPGQSAHSAVGTSDTRRQLVRLVSTFLVAGLLVLLDRGAIAAAVALFPLANGAHPFWLPAFGWLLYVRVPLVAISALVILLGPGLLLASAAGATRSWSWWILCGSALSLIVVSGSVGAIQIAAGTPVTGASFILVVLGCTLVCAAIAWVRADRATYPMIPPDARRNAIECAIALAVILAVLLPKFIWENYNGDGADALEVARLLLRQPVPFWPVEAGTVSSFPGITSMLFAYPAAWFVRIFGTSEFAARAPMLLALVCTHAGITALAECGVDAGNKLRRSARMLIWGALLIYTIVLAYSATYSPYSADLAMPAPQDTLFVALFAACAVAFAMDETAWMFVFGLLSYIALPSGLVLLAMLGAAALVVWRPVPRHRVIVLGAVIIVCVLLGALTPHVLHQAGFPQPGNEYSDNSLIGRLTLVQFTDWRRILYIVVPCGIAPAAAIFMLKRQDSLARTIALVTVGYFLFTYLQAYAKLHYYVPSMLLPVALYWRMAPTEGAGGRNWDIAAFAGLCGAMILALPRRAAPLTRFRDIASSIQVRVPGYERSANAEFRASDAIELIFPQDWDRNVPLIMGGSPLMWNYYLQHDTGAPTASANYVVQSDSDAVPAGFHVIGHRNGFVALARSDSLLAIDRARRLPVDPGSPLFRMAPGILFNYASESNGAPIHDIIDALARRGVPVGNLLDRSAVKH